jgi:glycosyltransferase involved in cell wall biosynthesis
MNPIVSLIMTAHNRQVYLQPAIESALAQTYTNFELLVWDDGSTDDSACIAHNYAQQDPRVRVISAPHQGISTSVNAAVAQTTGQYVGLVDSDDRLAPTALQDTIAILEQHPTIGMVYTDYVVIDADGKERQYGTRTQTPYSKEQLLVSFMTFHFRLLRRHLFEQVGGMDESLQYSVDYDLCLKLSEITEFHHLAKPLYFYRIHSDNQYNHQKRYQQIMCSRQALQNALERRGMAEEFNIELQIDCRTILRRK